MVFSICIIINMAHLKPVWAQEGPSSEVYLLKVGMMMGVNGAGVGSGKQKMVGLWTLFQISLSEAGKQTREPELAVCSVKCSAGQGTRSFKLNRAR